MSTLKVTNIQATGETASRAVSGVAAAWAKYSGSGSTFADSFNMTSATDNGTGDYSLTINNDMGNVNYCVSGTGANGNGSGSNLPIAGLERGHSPAVGSLTFNTKYNQDSGLSDTDQLFCSIHGDLA